MNIRDPDIAQELAKNELALVDLTACADSLLPSSTRTHDNTQSPRTITAHEVRGLPWNAHLRNQDGPMRGGLTDRQVQVPRGRRVDLELTAARERGRYVTLAA